MSDKMKQIKLNAKTLKPIEETEVVVAYRGTEKGHFYTNLVETSDFVIGARDLSKDCDPNWPKDGVETRIRFMLKEDLGGTLSEKNVKCFLGSLGFTKKRHSGETEDHYSVVTSKPDTVLTAVKAYLAAYQG